jgi:long-chain-fatty-acid--CoA ligase ACSBG
MEISSILYIIILIALIIIVLYYLYFIHDSNNECKKEIPYTFLYEQDTTIIDILKNISEKYGRYPALKIKNNSEWITISYAEYYKKTMDFSERLLYFIGPHSRVAILSFNRPEWFYSHMGTMMAGGVSVGIYPTSSSDNCSYIVNHSCVDVIIVEDIKQLEKLKDVNMPTVKLILLLDNLEKLSKYHDYAINFNNNKIVNSEDDEIKIISSIKKNNKQIDIISYNIFIEQSIGSYATNTVIEYGQMFPDEIATIIYTSGTTGDPKGVVITHKNLIETLKSSLNSITSRSNINIYIQESFISYLPLNHVAAQIMDIYVPLASVGIVHFADKDALKGSLRDTMKEIRPTVFIGVPRVWEKVYEKIKEKKEDPQKWINKIFVNSLIIQEMGLDRAKFCIAAAAPLSFEIKGFFKDLGIEICDIYGMSETTGPISMGVPGCSQGSGIPVMNVKIDKHTDEIMVKGDAVFKEYYKNKKATQEAFTKSGWFKTGDTGYVHRDGSLYVTGRIKDLIITAGGENISPIPIEENLLAALNTDKKLFDHAVVIGDRQKFLSVLLVPVKNYSNMINTNDTKQIQDHIKKSIDETNKKAPNNTSTVKKFIILDGETFEIGDCLTPTLKIRRKIIEEKYKSQINGMYVGGD